MKNLSKILSKEDLQKLYDNGLTQKDIAALYNTSSAPVNRLMKRYGIEARSNTEISILKTLDIGEHQKRCSKCKEIKDRGEFSKHSSNRSGLHSHCKSCVKIAYPLIKLKRKQRILSNEQIQVEKLHHLFDGIKSRAKVKELPFSINIEWLLERFKKQDGRCLLTGIKFEFSKTSKTKNPFSPSVDQIVPGNGYTEDNARLSLHRN